MPKTKRPLPPSNFTVLGLTEPLVRAVALMQYREPTPVQSVAIPALLEGRDIMSSAQTGTGKTAAFALPILQRVDALGGEPRPHRPRALVLAPTRELALQTTEAFRRYARYLRGIRIAAVFGGLTQESQAEHLRRGPHVVVGTPGRLIDLRAQELIDLSDVEIFVLDEADRMLDLGFLPDVRRIMAALPKERQAAFFSATLPPEVIRLGNELLRKPERLDVNRRAAAAEGVGQFACFIEAADRRATLFELLHRHPRTRALVFISAKRETNRLRAALDEEGFSVRMLHGRMHQTSRLHALEDFREGKVSVLVATDVAARGLDIKGVGLVVNFDLPSEPEQYIHRIGRTGRAGEQGIAITLCTASERKMLHAVQDLLRIDLTPLTDHAHHSPAAMDEVTHRPGQWRARTLRDPAFQVRAPRIVDWRKRRE